MNDRGSWLQQLADSPFSERRITLTLLVSGKLKVKLLMDDADDLPINKSYFELGLTSLGAIELQEELEQAIDNRIDATALYNNPTVENLVTHLCNEVLLDYFKAKNSKNIISENIVVEHESANKNTDAEKKLLEDILNEF